MSNPAPDRARTAPLRHQLFACPEAAELLELLWGLVKTFAINRIACAGGAILLIAALATLSHNIFGVNNGPSRWATPTVNSPMMRRASMPPSYSAAAGIGRRYLAGGTFRGASPHENPQANEIVFSAVKGNSADLYLYDEQHQISSRLTDTPFWELYPIFSKSGKYIIYVSDEHSRDGEFYSLEWTSGATQRIAPGVTYLRDDLPMFTFVGVCQPSPVDDRIVFPGCDANRQGGVYLYDIAKERLQRITADSEEACYPVWSAAGHFIAYSRYQQDKSGSPRWSICRYWLDDGRSEVLYETGPSPAVPIGTSKDETEVILYTIGHDSKYQLKVLTVGENQPRVLWSEAPDPVDPVWYSPSEEIAFAAPCSGLNSASEDDICVATLNGNARRLTNGGQYRAEPTFSADGRRIFFADDKPGAPARGLGELNSVSVKDGSPRTLLRFGSK